MENSNKGGWFRSLLQPSTTRSVAALVGFGIIIGGALRAAGDAMDEKVCVGLERVEPLQDGFGLEVPDDCLTAGVGGDRDVLR